MRKVTDMPGSSRLLPAAVAWTTGLEQGHRRLVRGQQDGREALVVGRIGDRHLVGDAVVGMGRHGGGGQQRGAGQHGKAERAGHGQLLAVWKNTASSPQRAAPIFTKR
jgi:hypothetical protein